MQHQPIEEWVALALSQCFDLRDADSTIADSTFATTR
jgi:hypothetical protein